MRTLKKTLALVLVVAMVLSMGVMGVNADFTDVAEDNAYYEAITVLTALGIIDGMTETTYAPEGTLTRAQAAKIITYVKLGATNAEKISAASGQRFDDVAVGENGHWAAAYIDYCANMGIINGVGENKFDPEGMLTTAAFTKMLLVAVGYEGEYTGDSWAINVAADAVENDLDHDDIVISNSIYISRAEAAQLALQAIQAVPPGGEASYMVEGSSLEFDTITEAVLYAQVNLIGGVMPTITAVSEDSLASKVFKMTEATTTADDWGRPGSVYTYGSDKDTVEFPAEADMMITELYKASVQSDKDDFAEMLEDADIKVTTGAFTVYLNGAMVTSINGDLPATYDMDTIMTLTDNGVCVELFTTDDVVTTVVVTVSAFGEVDMADKKETSSMGAYTEYSLPAVGVSTSTGAVDMEGKIFSTVVDEDDDVDTVVIEGTVEDGDDVLYTPLFKGNMEISVAGGQTGMLSGTGAGLSKIYIEEVTEMVEGEFDRYSATTYRIDGTDYEVSGAIGADFTAAVGTDVEWYLDEYGYLLGDAATTTTGINYVMLLKVANVNVLVDGVIEVENRVMIVDEAGTVMTVASDKDYTGTPVGAVYVATVSDDEYKLAAVTVADDVDAVTAITKGTAQLAADSYASNGTIFVKANYNDDNAVDGTVTIYTGINNVPSYSGLTKTFAISEDSTVSSVVFIYDQVDANSESAYIYVTDTMYTTADGKTYDTIKDGEMSTVSIDDAETLAMNTMYYSLKISGVGVPTEVVAVPEVGATAIKNNDGLLTTNTGALVGTVSDSTPVYTIDESAGTVEVGTAADLNVEGAKAIYVDNDDDLAANAGIGGTGEASAIYIIVD